MKFRTRAFVDSDVIISSLMSDQGAAALLVKNNQLDLIVSSESVKELLRVVERKHFSKVELQKNLQNMGVIPLEISTDILAKRYGAFAYDAHDAHIVAGAVAAKARFIITYNIKHYAVLPIKNRLGIIVLKPGSYFQYLRFLEII